MTGRTDQLSIAPSYDESAADTDSAGTGSYLSGDNKAQGRQHGKEETAWPLRVEDGNDR